MKKIGIIVAEKMVCETAKQIAIRIAYGEHWEFYKSKVDENGWVDVSIINNGNLDEDFENVEHQCEFQRPLSLQGIENNNGWMVPKSAKDYLEHDSYVFTNKQNIYSTLYYISHESICELQDVVYYQPITKPKPPIY